MLLVLGPMADSFQPVCLVNCIQFNIIIIIIFIATRLHITTDTFHDFLPPFRREKVMECQVRLHPQKQPTSLSPYTRHLRLDFQQLRLFYSLPQPHQVTASHPSPGDNPPERGRAVRKNAEPSKNCRVKLNHLHMHQASPLLLIFHALSCSLQHHATAAQSYLHAIHPT